MKPVTAVLCGNPNVGKSTVFNALTGLRQHTGNWTGKTVQSAKGRVRQPEGDWTLIDLPGAYSLIGGSPDELAASDYLLFGTYDVAVVVCDATCLARSLVLAMQTARLCRRTVVCINLLDEAEKRGIVIDAEKLSGLLRLPVVGVCARNRQGLCQIGRQVFGIADGKASAGEGDIESVWLPGEVRAALKPLTDALKRVSVENRKTETLALRFLCANDGERAQLLEACKGEYRSMLWEAITETSARFDEAAIIPEELREDLIAADHALAGTLAEECVKQVRAETQSSRRLFADRFLCSPVSGVPVMLALLVLLFYITLAGANIPSAWLSARLMGFEPVLGGWLTAMRVPAWVVGALAHGMYRSLAWVVSVMLPPMAIFFPLFTLLEDLGYLPRIAFNMDRCFRSCKACGKQALCMCMGLGCNAVGVTGCRIIQSPRERLLAILTNSMVPCNGRLPLLLLLITLFFSWAGVSSNALLSAVLLAALLVVCVLFTLLVCRILSSTLLKGLPSTFVLELPPFRRPKVGQLLVRSMLDRTVFVLLRAVSVAAPAGLVLWLLGNVEVNGTALLQHAAQWLDPFGRLMGMDGVILLAFVLGLPANEIVLPIMLMIYLQQGQLISGVEGQALAEILRQNGWGWATAASTALFTLFHWPCSTTILTIRKETGSTLWTAVAVMLPTLLGILLCIALRAVVYLFTVVTFG